MSKLKELYQQKLAELEKIKIALEVEEQYIATEVPISARTNSIDLVHKKGGKSRTYRYEAMNLPSDHAYVVIDKI